MPTETVSARPDALLRFPAATAGPTTAVVVHGPLVEAAVVRAVGGGLAGRLPAGFGLGGRLVAHGQRAAALADSTASTGIAFALAGGPLGVLALLSPLAGVDDDAVAAYVASVLGVADDGAVHATTVDPDEVARLVSSLSPEQLARLVAEHPALVGPVDGMPVELRFAANQLLLLRQADVLEDAGLTERAHRLREQFLGHQILFYDPAGGGRIAEVLGDLATARNIAVVVPGMGNDLGNFTDATLGKAENIIETAGDGTAVIAWLGYNSPGIPEVVLDDDALDGAAALCRLFDGLPEHALRTVVGHSYGTVVTAAALQRGLEVDQVIVTGSPGMLGPTEQDVAGDIPIYAARAPGDAISWSENFGRDPSDPRFGATRIDTGNSIWFHSNYFAEGTESLTNIVRIVTGRPEEITTIDPGAAEYLLDWVDDAWADAQSRIDSYQELGRDLQTAVNWVVDGTQPVLPGPIEHVVDGLQNGSGTIFEVNNRIIDLGQRITSPGFIGDAALDAWDLAHDHLDEVLEGAGDLAGDAVDAAGDLAGDLVGGAGDLLGGFIR